MKKLVVHLTEDELKTLIEDAVQVALSRQTPIDQPPPRYLTRKQAAEMCHVSLMTLNSWRKSSILTPSYIGGRALYSSAQIEKILNTK